MQTALEYQNKDAVAGWFSLLFPRFLRTPKDYTLQKTAYGPGKIQQQPEPICDSDDNCDFSRHRTRTMMMMVIGLIEWVHENPWTFVNCVLVWSQSALETNNCFTISQSRATSYCQNVCSRHTRTQNVHKHTEMQTKSQEKSIRQYFHVTMYMCSGCCIWKRVEV